MFSLRSLSNGGLLDEHKFSAPNNSNNSAGHIPPTVVKLEPQQPVGAGQQQQQMAPQSPFGPSPFFRSSANPSPLVSSSPTHHFHPPMPSASQQSHGANAGPPHHPLSFLPFIQMVAAARCLANNSPNQQQQKQQPCAPSSSSSSSSSASSSTAAGPPCPSPAQLHNGVFHQPPIGQFLSAGPKFPIPSTATTFPPTIQQLQHNLLLFQQQQMQQQQQQQQSQNSPKPSQQSPPIAADPMAHQQFWLQVFAALTMANGGGLPQMPGGDRNCENTAMNADKKLGRDMEGNALCPACHEPIGKECAQWAEHLEMERTKLRKAIQELKKKAQETGQTTNMAADANDSSWSEEKRQSEAILERIRQNQSKRIDAKLKGHFYLASESLSAMFGSGMAREEGGQFSKESSAIDGQQNGQNSPEKAKFVAKKEEEEAEMENGNNDEEEEEEKKDNNTIRLKGKNNNNGEEEEGRQICLECQRASELLVLNVHSKMVHCLDCFHQRGRQNNGSGIGGGGELTAAIHSQSSNNGNNGFAWQSIGTRKRGSPSFSALQLATSTDSTEQKRAKLELTAE